LEIVFGANIAEMITDKLLAELLGVSPTSIRQLVFKGIKPEGESVQRWTLRQALAVLVRNNCRRAGASKVACNHAFRILATADVAKLREALRGGHRFLRLMGDVCDERLVTERAAFDSKLLRAATTTGTPYVVADVEHWLAVADHAIERSSEPVDLCEGTACKS
jgi:hypothetical protein